MSKFLATFLLSLMAMAEFGTGTLTRTTTKQKAPKRDRSSVGEDHSGEPLLKRTVSLRLKSGHGNDQEHNSHNNGQECPKMDMDQLINGSHEDMSTETCVKEESKHISMINSKDSGVMPSSYSECTPSIWVNLGLKQVPDGQHMVRYTFYENLMADKGIVAWGNEANYDRNYCGEFELMAGDQCRWVAGDAPELFIAASRYHRHGCQNGTFGKDGTLRKFDMFDFDPTWTEGFAEEDDLLIF